MPRVFTLGIAPPGLEPPGRANKKRPRFSAAVLPLLGSNQDSPDPESGVLPVTPRGSFLGLHHGAEGDRTPDLLIANEALSQLSYSPDLASGSAEKDEKNIGKRQPG